uniref:HDC19808 n=1 Tax=Drosophila melanogaster TaxID=7227 RepID=Q6II43_DROME|nr:TPA_inf: HDC19808 [Drosophila melanogaster]
MANDGESADDNVGNMQPLLAALTFNFLKRKSSINTIVNAPKRGFPSRVSEHWSVAFGQLSAPLPHSQLHTTLDDIDSSSEQHKSISINAISSTRVPTHNLNNLFEAALHLQTFQDNSLESLKIPGTQNQTVLGIRQDTCLPYQFHFGLSSNKCYTFLQWMSYVTDSVTMMLGKTNCSRTGRRAKERKLDQQERKRERESEDKARLAARRQQQQQQPTQKQQEQKQQPKARQLQHNRCNQATNVAHYRDFHRNHQHLHA